MWYLSKNEANINIKKSKVIVRFGKNEAILIFIQQIFTIR